jgi:hypothetical protein
MIFVSVEIVIPGFYYFILLFVVFRSCYFISMLSTLLSELTRFIGFMITFITLIVTIAIGAHKLG